MHQRENNESHYELYNSRAGVITYIYFTICKKNRPGNNLHPCSYLHTVGGHYLVFILSLLIHVFSEQEELKLRLVEVDSEAVLSWGSAEGLFSQLHHVAGVDISFMKESPIQACAMISILNFPQLEVR